MRPQSFRRSSSHIAASFSLLFCCACSASTQKPAVETVLSSPATRTESFEATLRVLDEHPEYVDELFARARKHRPTLERLLEDNAVDLADNDLARRTAAHLAMHPAGLYRTMLKTLDAISDKQLAMAAVAKAMTERPQVAAMVITQREEATISTLTALVKEVQKNDRARRAFLTGVEDNSDALARLLVANPRVLGALVKAMGSAGASKGRAELAALGKALGDSD
jgi:hypothetical protein